MRSNTQLISAASARFTRRNVQRPALLRGVGCVDKTHQSRGSRSKPVPGNCTSVLPESTTSASHIRQQVYRILDNSSLFDTINK